MEYNRYIPEEQITYPMQLFDASTTRFSNTSIDSATSSGIKWNEVLSLGALNIAIAISWIAYLEYQPVILQNFNAVHLGSFLVIAKAIILVIVPILAGYVADRILANRGRFFMVFMIGISATAMVFMVVASLISMGPSGTFASILPIMIVLWLISMSIFIAPAFSMIERFASRQKLPIVMGAIVLITEVVYALEPLVIELVRFFGETLTFIVGGILVLGTGILFNRLSSDEVAERTSLAKSFSGDTKNPYLVIAGLGLVLGLGRAFLVEFVPENATLSFLNGKQISFILLALSASVAFLMSQTVSKKGTSKYLKLSLVALLAGVGISSLFDLPMLFFGGLLLLTLSLGIAHLCGLPYAFNRLTPKNTTIGIGIFLGTSALAEGLFEIYYMLA